MATLNSTRRSFLEKTIVKARQLSEAGAIKAMQNLAIDQPEPFTHMDTDQRTLRRRLRSKARLLGDEIINGKQQKIDHLSYELAYECWHKMLFAKFLEANNLLIHPEDKVAVSFEDCEELAKEEGYSDKWTAAANYASHMFPAIFKPEDPLMQVEFATEDRIALERLLESIEEYIFKAGDSLGWVYQFWQSEEKDRINKSEEKIDGEKLPAVTQFFTEPYMVHFLIDNTIGAWWASRHPGEKPPVEFEYLRLLDDGTPAAGKFEGWPDAVKDITTLDPCMGSGHFIVELFNVLAPLRMHEEGLSKEEATRKVINDNLHGLEIDPRCTQIAAFNLALTAWKFNGKYIDLAELNLACCGIAPKGKREDWLKLANTEKDTNKRERLSGGLNRMYELFQKAPELGSLIDPTTVEKDIFTSDFKELQPFLEIALRNEKGEDENYDRGVVAAGIAKAGNILAKKYVWQITNVPYLGRGRQEKGGVIQNFSEEFYPSSKKDLATVFFEKMLLSCDKCGTSSVVLPQNWLFLTTYKSFRETLLKNYQWNIVARLGAGAFSNISGEVVKIILLSISNLKILKNPSFSGLDVSNLNSVRDKDNGLLISKIKILKQEDQKKNPDSRIIFDELKDILRLNNFAYTGTGLQTFDRPRFALYFWEISKLENGWLLLQSTPSNDSNISGMQQAIKWQEGKGELFEYMQMKEKEGYKSGIWKAGSQFWGMKGIIHGVMSNLPHSLYLGYPYDTNAAVIIPKDNKFITSLWAFSNEGEFSKEVRLLDQKLMVTNATFIKVPFDLSYWQKVAAERYPNGLPDPYSDDPTQWLFYGHPKPSENPLQVAISRLLGYQWPAEKDEDMELTDEARQYIEEIKTFDYLADEDGIVCIPPVNEELAASERLRDYIKEVWQDEWDNNTISNLLRQAGSKKTNLEQWLREEFFEQHIKLFYNRPFIWHIWDGRKDGFSALVNYHKLDKAKLQKLIFTYLGDWIRQCKHKVRNNESGAEGLLLAAQKLKEQLELILEGESPYNIFIRWKPLEKQPIGWEPDINDGVRLNIYPFIQAGILKKKPNIKWGKDRGKNPSGPPWGPDRYNRYEDLADEYKIKDDNKKIIPHLTNKIKRKARESVNA